MNPLFILIMFLVLFATVLVAISLGYRFLEAQRKRQVASMLEVASGVVHSETQAPILLDSADDPVAHLLREAAFTRRLSRFIQQSGLPWTITHLVILVAVTGGVGALLGYFLRPLGFVSLSSLGAAMLLGWIPIAFLRWKRKTRVREFEEQLPEALDFLARSMRAGHAFSISLEMLGAESPDPLGQEFRTLFNELNLGATLDQALTNFAVRVPLLDIRLFVSSVLLQKQTGGNLSEILMRLAYVIRERFRLRGQVRAASAHGRMTALVLTLLPIVLVVALMFIAPGYLQLLANDSDGKYIVLAAILAQLVGYLVMRRITDIKV